MIKNRIDTIFDRYPEVVKKLKPPTDWFGKAGREQLKPIPLSEIGRLLVDRECAFIDELNKYIKQAKGTLKDWVNTHPDVKRLVSIPGIGQFTAWLLLAKLDTIGRFRNAKQLAAYEGLVPSTYSSGGKTFYGRMIKGANNYIRWAMVEAIARKLLTIVYHVLKEKRNYK